MNHEIFSQVWDEYNALMDAISKYGTKNRDAGKSFVRDSYDKYKKISDESFVLYEEIVRKIIELQTKAATAQSRLTN